MSLGIPRIDYDLVICKTIFYQATKIPGKYPLITTSKLKTITMGLNSSKIFLYLLIIALNAQATSPKLNLANTYQPGTIKLSDYWVSEKYDGVRAYWDGQKLVSRNGNTFFAPNWFIAGLPAEPLDGELFLGHGRFADTSGIVRRQTAHVGWKNITYLVFDLPAHPGTFEQRYAALIALFKHAPSNYWQVVRHDPIVSEQALKTRFNTTVQNGGEGLMLRRIRSIYQAKRNDDLLKYKPFTDAEAVVINYTEGKGKYLGQVGALIVKNQLGQVFKIGSGLSDAERQNPPPIGATISYKYQGLTKNNLPRFPVYLRLRNDEPESGKLEVK